MKYDGSEAKDDIKNAFPDLTVKQLWVIVKIIRHCRKFCRNNAALTNWLNRNFDGFSFKEYQNPEEDFKRLEITKDEH